MSVMLSASLISCRKSEMQETGTGYLYVSVDKDSGEDLVFKSTPEEGMVFSLTVYNEMTGKVAGHVDDYRTLGESPMSLPAGNFDYRAVASSGTDGAAAFDSPFYSGETTFRISPDQVSNVDIACSLANVKVTAVFSDEIKAGFKEYILTVSNGAGQLVFDNTAEPATTDREGYFSATGTLEWSLRLVNNNGEVYEELRDSYTDVKPRQHYNLSFSIKEEEPFGGGAVSIVLDDSMNEKEYDLVLNLGGGSGPEISSDFEITDPVEVNAGDATSRKLHIASVDGFSSLILSYGEMQNLGSAAEYELAGAASDVITSLSEDGIVAVPVSQDMTETDIDITSYVQNLPIGEHFVKLFVTDAKYAYKETLVKFNVLSSYDVEAVSANPWTMFAELTAKWLKSEQPEGIGIQYRKTADADWTDFSGQLVIDAAKRTFSAEVRNLEPETEYEFRAVSASGAEAPAVTFTTQAAETLYNMGFDEWYMKDNETWYIRNGEESPYIWDSANPGTGSYGYNPTTPEDNIVAVAGEGKRAAKLESQKAKIVIVETLAAGNIYTGVFGKPVVSISNPGAELDWGVPFSSRPLALKGYFHYLPKTVDYGNHNNMSGKSDICQIQVMLADWSSPFHVNTSAGTFLNPQTDPGIIAYGSLECDHATESYQQFEIRLDYRDRTRMPKYIVIVAAASKYGDYFTGGVGSTLYLDEFEFVYDPNELTE